MEKARLRVLFVLLFLVTWRTFKASPAESGGQCMLDSESHQEEFSSWFDAAARAHDLKMDERNYDVKTWEMEEPTVKERK